MIQLCFVVLVCSDSTSAQCYGLQYDPLSVCPTESRYCVSFRDLRWVDLVCPECALLHRPSLPQGCLAGMLPAHTKGFSAPESFYLCTSCFRAATRWFCSLVTKFWLWYSILWCSLSAHRQFPAPSVLGLTWPVLPVQVEITAVDLLSSSWDGEIKMYKAREMGRRENSSCCGCSLFSREERQDVEHSTRSERLEFCSGNPRGFSGTLT